MMEPEQFVADAVADAEKRSPRVLSSPSFLSDEDWETVSELCRAKGPLTGVEALMYLKKHDACAKKHFIDFVFEIERLYEIVRLMNAR